MSSERPDIDRLAKDGNDALDELVAQMGIDRFPLEADAPLIAALDRLRAALDELVALARDRAGYLRDFLAASERAEAAEARVAELEAALREVERYFGSELPPAGFPLGAVRAALTGDGSGA